MTEIDDECKQYTIKEYILFKLDRNVAILGLIALGICAMSVDLNEPAQKIVSAVIGALAVYIGARGR